MSGTWEELKQRQRRRERRLKIAGAAILLAVGFFLARFHLTKIPAYEKIEGKVVRTLKLDRAGKQAARVLGLDREDEELARSIAERRERREREEASRARLEVVVPPPPVTPSRYRVTPLPDKDYHPAVLKELARAEKSVYLAIFLIAPDPPRGPVIRLLDGLIAARKRGVKVKVAIHHPGKIDDSVFNHNRSAIAYLKEGGVAAYFADPKTRIHDKFLLIDDRVMILGNHNWTREALTIHRELSLLVVSNPPDPAFARHFAAIRLAKLEDTPEGKLELIDLLHRELLSREKQG
jgi:phosphatidylserine/phosphatidylglycerophosphate/cardiolipin synthase-like enzyme